MNDQRRVREYNFRGKVRAPSVTDAWMLDLIGSGIVLSVVFFLAWGVTTWVMM